MIPAALPNPPIHASGSGSKLSAQDAARIARERNGVSALILLLRDDRVDADVAIAAINEAQGRTSQKFKRLMMALVNTVLPD